MIAALVALLLAPPAAETALLRGSLRLIGRFSTAHACPIEPRLALTNGHVIDQRPFDESVKPFPYAWSDGTGASGFLVPLELERARDLARVAPLREGDVFPNPLPLAARAPSPGERLKFLGYDWGTKKSAMADEVVEVKVTRVVALHVLFYPSGQPGSSGSCLVNEAGEVVAINEGGYETDAEADMMPLMKWLRKLAKDNEAGLAVGVWGGLHRMPE